MPVVNVIPQLSSPPTNIFGLYQYLAQRLPGYDISEYVRELNSAYIHVWEEVTKLENNYFTNVSTLTVSTAGTNFDLQYNSSTSGVLSGVLSNRLYQITRIRVLPPSSQLYQNSRALSPNDPDFIGLAANPGSTPAYTGPYYYYMYGRNNICWALPLAVGTQLEFTYTFWPLALTYSYAGTVVSTSGTIITGNGSAFKSLIQPDFYAVGSPATKQQQEMMVELICNVNQIYNIQSINSDTVLVTQNTVAPALVAGSPYVIATLPEIPREHIRVIASIATAKMYSIDGDDQRVREWTAISEKNIQMMKDSIMARQGQNPPRKQRFPYGIGRRNRGLLG